MMLTWYEKVALSPLPEIFQGGLAMRRWCSTNPSLRAGDTHPWNLQSIWRLRPAPGIQKPSEQYFQFWNSLRLSETPHLFSTLLKFTVPPGEGQKPRKQTSGGGCAPTWRQGLSSLPRQELVLLPAISGGRSYVRRREEAKSALGREFRRALKSDYPVPVKAFLSERHFPEQRLATEPRLNHVRGKASWALNLMRCRVASSEHMLKQVPRADLHSLATGIHKHSIISNPHCLCL